LQAGQTEGSPPYSPASHCPSQPFTHLLNLYRGCVAERRWARFTLETLDGEEELSFCCRSIPASASAAATSPMAPTARRHCRKRKPNEKRREKARRRRDAWKEKRRGGGAASGAAKKAGAAELAAPEVAEEEEASAVAAAVGAAEELTASATAADKAGSATAATATAAAATAAAATAAAATAAAATAAAATAAAATAVLRQKWKIVAGERRSSARALILARRRDSDGADVLRSPDLAVSELEISWDSGQREEPDWKEKELEEGAEELESEKEPEREEPESEKWKEIPPTSTEVICRVCWQGQHTFSGSLYGRCYLCRMFTFFGMVHPRPDIRIWPD